MTKLHPSTSLETPGAWNTCVPTALALATGEPASRWLERLRARDPRCCTKRRGTSPATYVPATQQAGYSIRPLFMGNWRNTLPLHMACALLKGRVGVLVVRSGGYESHMIAAEGFMVGDCNVTPRWWADFLERWSLRWVGRRAIVRSRVRAQVLSVYLIERSAA